jgi:hypothetical protein
LYGETNKKPWSEEIKKEDVIMYENSHFFFFSKKECMVTWYGTSLILGKGGGKSAKMNNHFWIETQKISLKRIYHLGFMTKN